MSQEFIPAARPIIGEEERAAVDGVLRSGMVAQGPQVKAFEEEFAAHVVAGRECVAVNSGTSGLHLGLSSTTLTATSTRSRMVSRTCASPPSRCQRARTTS